MASHRLTRLCSGSASPFATRVQRRAIVRLFLSRARVCMCNAQWLRMQRQRLAPGVQAPGWLQGIYTTAVLTCLAVAAVQENLQEWLMDPRGRDEFVVRHGDETEVRAVRLLHLQGLQSPWHASLGCPALAVNSGGLFLAYRNTCQDNLRTCRVHDDISFKQQCSLTLESRPGAERSLRASPCAPPVTGVVERRGTGAAGRGVPALLLDGVLRAVVCPWQPAGNHPPAGHRRLGRQVLEAHHPHVAPQCAPLFLSLVQLIGGLGMHSWWPVQGCDVTCYNIANRALTRGTSAGQSVGPGKQVPVARKPLPLTL